MTDIAKRLRKPWTTIRRTLAALYVLELVNEIETADEGAEEEDENKDSDKSGRKGQRYGLVADIDLSVLEPRSILHRDCG